MQIVLKDHNNTDVVFTHISTVNGKMTFQAQGSSLMDAKRLEISLSENANTNRIRTKLSVPTMCAESVGCKPVILYTQVSSSDITVVKFSTLDDRKLINALEQSVLSSTVIKNLVENAQFPA